MIFDSQEDATAIANGVDALDAAMGLGEAVSAVGYEFADMNDGAMSVQQIAID